MLQIEQNLKDDSSGIYKSELLNRFNQVASEVRFELNQGVDPTEYEKLNRLLQALEASAEVVDKVWFENH